MHAGRGRHRDATGGQPGAVHEPADPGARCLDPAQLRRPFGQSVRLVPVEVEADLGSYEELAPTAQPGLVEVAASAGVVAFVARLR